MEQVTRLTTIAGGAIGGGAKGSELANNLQDVITTPGVIECIVYSVIGAVIGFLVSKFCAWAWKKLFK